MKVKNPNHDLLRVTLSRRGLLQYAGMACVSMPLMRTLLETDPAFAQSSRESRALFVYYPDGNIADKFFPTEIGKNFSLPEITSPLSGFREKIALVRGLHMPISGSHEAGAAFCLTGVDKKGTRYSIDNYLGDRIGEKFPQKVARLGVGANFQSGSDKCISYLSSGALASIQDNPRVAFADLMGPSDLSPGDREKLAQGRKSILDYARNELQSLKAKLGKVEEQKIDNHLTGLRELERRLGSTGNGSCRGGVDLRGLSFPENEQGYPKSFEKNENFGLIAQIMADLMVNILACGVAPVGLLQWSHAVSPTTMNFRGGPGVDQGHHDVSHYGGDPNGVFGKKFVACQRWYMEQVAYLLKALDGVRIGDHSLLDETVVMVTTELGDSERHNFDEVGVLLASGGKGRLATGVSLKKDKMEYSRILVTVLRALGLSDEFFGDESLGRGAISELIRS